MTSRKKSKAGPDVVNFRYRERISTYTFVPCTGISFHQFTPGRHSQADHFLERVDRHLALRVVYKPTHFALFIFQPDFDKFIEMRKYLWARHTAGTGNRKILTDNVGFRVALLPHFKNGHAWKKDDGPVIEPYLDFFLSA
jgi:hypothetical protein